MHRSLGLALVPWVLAGGVAAIVANHSSGIAGTCPDASAAAARAAELAAQRALGHLMVGASLAGERVEFVDGSADWIDPDQVDLEDAADRLPQWAHVERLSGFELPPAVDSPAPDALLAFQIESAGETWQCALALDGELDVARASGEGALDSLLGDAHTGQDPASVALVDLVAAAGLVWALCSCVVLCRSRDRRRADLVALAAGAGVLALFVTTL